MFGCLDRKEMKKHYAYTMAEMLIVMVIIAVVMLSLPKATKKLFRVDTVRANHSRYECYWDHGVLKQHTVTETLTGQATGNSIVNAREYSGRDDVCVFTPPDNTPYVIMHAVGGGGGGVNVWSTLEPKSDSTSLAYFNKTEKDLWPDWFSSNGVQNFAFTTTNAAAENKGKKVKDVDYYEVDSVYSSQPVKYRPSGTAGTLKSMFFPNLPPGSKLIIKPGKGGDMGAAASSTVSYDGGNGNRTIVRIAHPGVNLGTCIDYANTDNTTCSNGCCDLVIADGGKGGSTLSHDGTRVDLKQTVMLTGGIPRDYDISNYGIVKEKESGFSMVLANDSNVEDLASEVPVNAGNGGRGANQFVTDTSGSIIYELNDYAGIIGGGMVYGTKWISVSNHVSENIYASGNCSEGDFNGTVWAKRRGYCIPAFGVCFIGNIKVTPNVAPGMTCDDKAHCARYTLGGTNENPTVTGAEWATQNYRNCKYDTSFGGISCEEKVTSGRAHNCTTPSAGSGGSKCANKSTPTGNVCEGSKGGDGAVVILW